MHEIYLVFNQGCERAMRVSQLPNIIEKILVVIVIGGVYKFICFLTPMNTHIHWLDNYIDKYFNPCLWMFIIHHI